MMALITSTFLGAQIKAVRQEKQRALSSAAQVKEMMQPLPDVTGMPSLWSGGTKEMMQPCLLMLLAISWVAGGTAEMMQPLPAATCMPPLWLQAAPRR